jgi:lipopolysaccharide/colanic/teichoic acid biosynthesis glycosyltransferase
MILLGDSLAHASQLLPKLLNNYGTGSLKVRRSRSAGLELSCMEFPSSAQQVWRLFLSSNGFLSSRFASQPRSILKAQTFEQSGSLEGQETGSSVSAWSQSHCKRTFDIICVLLVAPLVLPVCICVGIAVRLTSRGPALFKQERSGLHGVTFAIFKFRTMEHKTVHKAEANLNKGFTSIGPFLRRWKLDELPQLLNVLLGDMSLVGPRPKIVEHQLGILPCRPGITGAATLVFANEEAVLAMLPQEMIREYFHATVLPAKLHLDRKYMADATFSSDFDLIIRTLTRRWDRNTIFHLLGIEQANPTANWMEGVHCSTLEFSIEEAAHGE